MEALTLERRLEAFRATDAFVLEAFRASAQLRTGGAGELGEAIRRAAVAAGAALVGASAADAGSASESTQLDRARVALIESRYFLYLARRFGLLDPKQYRALTLRQDAASREIEALRPRRATRAERGPP